MSTTSHMKIYKNKSKCNEELRRKREEEGIQLRKKKKDEQVAFNNYKFFYTSFYFLYNRVATHSG